MKPIDLRNATWTSLQTDIQGRLISAYQAWLAHGPGTTREVAGRAAWDILSLRPRTTDLYHAGLVELIGQRRGQGIYRARTQAEWETWAAGQRQQLSPSPQQNLL